MQQPLDISTKHYFWKPYAAYFRAFELKAYQNFVSLPNDGLILDLGCSDGKFGQMLKELLKFKAPLVGVDIDQDELKQAAKLTSVYSKVLQLDASHLTFDDESFDAVFANGVIYALRPNPKQALREIRRILKKNGTFICTVPTHLFEQHYGIVKLLRRLGLRQLERLYVQRMSIRLGEFVSTFSAHEWRELLEDNQFIVQNLVPYASKEIIYWWSWLTLTPLRVMGLLKFIPLKWLHRLSSKMMKRLMLNSYNQLSTTIRLAEADCVLIIAKKL